MENPNPNQAGIIAFALVDAFIDRLAANGSLSGDDTLAILNSALQKFRGDTRVFAAPSREFLEAAIKRHPLSK